MFHLKKVVKARKRLEFVTKILFNLFQLNLRYKENRKDYGIEIFEYFYLPWRNDEEFNEYFKKSLEDAEGFGAADFKVTDVGGEVTDSLLKPKSVVDTIKNIPSDVLEGIKDFDVQEAISTGLQSSVTGALKLTGTQKLSKAFGYETPEGPSSYFIDIPEMVDAGVASPSVFNDVDFSTQKQGNNYLVSNVQNSRFLNNLVNSDSAYDAYMANFAASQFTPMQRALGMGV